MARPGGVDGLWECQDYDERVLAAASGEAMGVRVALWGLCWRRLHGGLDVSRDRSVRCGRRGAEFELN